MTRLVMHYSNIIIGERLAIGFLLVVLVGMIVYRENRKSTRYLGITA